MSKIVSDELRKILGKYDTFTVLEVREKVTNDFMFLFESSTKTGYHFVLGLWNGHLQKKRKNDLTNFRSRNEKKKETKRNKKKRNEILQIYT